ncbi:peptide ABC transporter ATP-binding protein [Salinigranum marinum]|uniref:peptide ABC transporter ATP-binding protein n=1 Tax=Salinigranum marinum TaxID=1515595 RepID=UPI00298A07E0|nr:peptide ABC transporter ATP-binding protein [Salinigranum marinum]
MSNPTEAEPRAPLSVATDLTLTVNGAEAAVRSTGERLFVEFPSLSAALRALGGIPGGEADRLTDLLRTTDLTVEVRVRDRTVAVAGAEAQPGVVSRRLGVAPIESRLGGVLGAVGRELAAAVEAVDRTFR